MPHSFTSRFEPQGVLGIGPLGTIYTVVEKSSGRKMAFRAFMRPDDAVPAEWQQAIDRHNQALTVAQRLSHPNIARVWEFGEEKGVYYILTEWFDGEALPKKQERGEKFTCDQALSIVGQAGRAIEYVAQMGGRHGDISPYTLILDRHDVVHIVNFGLAHCRAMAESWYRAPEELSGAPGDARSDLFSLGLILFELLEGYHPFRATTLQETQAAVIQLATPTPANAPVYVQGIVQKLLAKRPEERYQSWAEAAADIANGRAPAPPSNRAFEAPAQLQQEQASLAQYRLGSSDILSIKHKSWKKKQARKSILGQRATTVVRWASAALVLGLLGHAVAARMTENTAALELVNGDVQLARLDEGSKKHWQPGTAGAALKPLDLIRTGAGSSARVRIGDGSRVMLGSKSLLTVRRVEFTGRKMQRERAFYLAQGTVYVSVRHRPNQRFAIETPFGVATAKGTEYSVTVSPEGGATVRTLSGQVEAKAPEGMVLVSGGKESDLTEGKKPTDPAALDLDQQKALSEALIKLADTGLKAAMGNLLNGIEDATTTRIGDGVTSLASLLKGSKDPHLRKGSAVARAQTGMRALVYALETANNEGAYPDSINPTTLEELGADEDMRERILGQFKGKRLQSYKRVGNGYEITALTDDDDARPVIARNGKVWIKGDE